MARACSCRLPVRDRNRDPDLHQHALFQRDFFHNVPKLRMNPQSLIDFVPELGVLVSQLVVSMPFPCRSELSASQKPRAVRI